MALVMFVLTTYAHASVVLDLGTLSVTGSSYKEFTFNLTGQVDNIAINLTYLDPEGQNGDESDEAADHMLLQIISPFGENGSWGGYNLIPAGSIFKGHWDFRGVPTDSGNFSDLNNPVLMNATGLWTIRVWNGWSGGQEVTYGVQVGLEGSIVPSPSVLAVLALAGLVGRRRR